MKISRIIKLAEKYGFILHEYKENEVLCGYEMESWTNNGVNMIHFIDCRKVNYPDGLNIENILKELEEIVDLFDVDMEIDLHRQDERFRMAFSIRQALDDFENYEKRLTEFAEAIQAEYDNFNTMPQTRKI